MMSLHDLGNHCHGLYVVKANVWMSVAVYHDPIPGLNLLRRHSGTAVVSVSTTTSAACPLFFVLVVSIRTTNQISYHADSDTVLSHASKHRLHVGLPSSIVMVSVSSIYWLWRIIRTGSSIPTTEGAERRLRWSILEISASILTWKTGPSWESRSLIWFLQYTNTLMSYDHIR